MIDRGRVALLGLRIGARVVPALPRPAWRGWPSLAARRPTCSAAARAGAAGRQPRGRARRSTTLIWWRCGCARRSGPRPPTTSTSSGMPRPDARRDRAAASTSTAGRDLEAAAGGRRGAILAAAHLGNIDLVAQVACARGLPVTIPIEPLEPPELLDLVTGLRAAHGLELVPVDRGALRAVACGAARRRAGRLRGRPRRPGSGRADALLRPDGPALARAGRAGAADRRADRAGADPPAAGGRFKAGSASRSRRPAAGRI